VTEDLYSVAARSAVLVAFSDSRGSRRFALVAAVILDTGSVSQVAVQLLATARADTRSTDAGECLM
jgi:hypothetical protein